MCFKLFVCSCLVLKSLAVMKEKRLAADGWMYSEEEFIAYYGCSTGNAIWERAGVEEPGTTAVPTSPNEHTETVSECMRRANDGYLYTLGEFVLIADTN